MSPFASVLPSPTGYRAPVDRDHLAISYVEARTRFDSTLGGAGTVVRGQEFTSRGSS